MVDKGTKQEQDTKTKTTEEGIHPQGRDRTLSKKKRMRCGRLLVYGERVMRGWKEGNTSTCMRPIIRQGEVRRKDEGGQGDSKIVEGH
jgi:hypothetical protein